MHDAAPFGRYLPLHNTAIMIILRIQRLLPHHHPQLPPPTQPQPAIIHPIHAIKLGHVHLRRGRRFPQDSRAVDGVVDAAEAVDDGVEEGLDKRLGGDVARESEDGYGRVGGGDGGCGLGEEGGVDVGDGEAGAAGAGEGVGGCGADACAAVSILFIYDGTRGGGSYMYSTCACVHVHVHTYLSQQPQ